MATMAGALLAEVAADLDTRRMCGRGSPPSSRRRNSKNGRSGAFASSEALTAAMVRHAAGPVLLRPRPSAPGLVRG